MPLIFQKMIYRSDLRANPNVIYIFGDNVARKGYGGQAKEMRGEPNAHGIPTKWRPSMDRDAFFTDSHECFGIVTEHFAEVHNFLRRGELVVFPLDGIGTGFSKLWYTAPKLDGSIFKTVSHLANKFPLTCEQ